MLLTIPLTLCKFTLIRITESSERSSSFSVHFRLKVPTIEKLGKIKFLMNEASELYEAVSEMKSKAAMLIGHAFRNFE